MNLSGEQWEKINEIIKVIYLSDKEKLLEYITSELSELFFYSHSMYHYYRYNGNKLISEDYHSVDLPEEVLSAYENHFENIDFIAWYSDTPVSRAFRDTDILDQNLRLNSEFMRYWMEPNHMYYGINSTIAYDNTAFAGLSFFRTEEEGDFSDIDKTILSIVNDHLSVKFYISQKVHTLGNGTNDFAKKYKLSAKEMEILTFIRNGVLREELPEKLCISDNTLKKHLTHIYGKLNINRFEQLIQLLAAWGHS